MTQRAVLLHQAPGEPWWSLPGGRVEFGKPSAATIQRELHEELGIEAKAERLLFVAGYFFTSAGPYHEIAFYYKTRGEGLPQSERFSGRAEDRDPPLIFGWVRLEDLDTLTVYPKFPTQELRSLSVGVKHIVATD